MGPPAPLNISPRAQSTLPSRSSSLPKMKFKTRCRKGLSDASTAERGGDPERNKSGHTGSAWEGSGNKSATSEFADKPTMELR
jgi:hypothetical protein